MKNRFSKETSISIEENNDNNKGWITLGKNNTPKKKEEMNLQWQLEAIKNVNSQQYIYEWSRNDSNDNTESNFKGKESITEYNHSHLTHPPTHSQRSYK